MEMFLYEFSGWIFICTLLTAELLNFHLISVKKKKRFLTPALFIQHGGAL